MASLQRTTVSFFGIRNAGKSSLVNAVTAQDISIVSDVKGTTTDPVKKTMELLPIGPVVIIDTPGIDDEGELGDLRVQKTLRILETTDIAVLVRDSTCIECNAEKELVSMFREHGIPYVIALNKCDILENANLNDEKPNVITVSAKTGKNIKLLKDKIASLVPNKKSVSFVSDFISQKDIVILVIPIDSAAPKDRIILPQQMAVRDILDAGAVPVCTGVQNLLETLSFLNKKPALVITDSQAFREVNQALPSDIPLTSFSILMARFKGTLEQSLCGIKKLDSLSDGDIILISEGCTHHRQCDDIGTVKIPSLCTKYFLKNNPGKKLSFEFSSGGSFPSDLKKYALVIHCGACMLNEKEMQFRLSECKKQNIPVTNYGMFLSYVNGILERTLAPLKELSPSLH